MIKIGLLVLLCLIAAAVIWRVSSGVHARSAGSSRTPRFRAASTSDAVRGHEFWNWFMSQDLLHMEPNALVQTIAPRLSKVDDRLKCTVSSSSQPPRELIISADGNADAIDAVRALCAAAPALPDWRITAFRPREDRYAEFSIEMDHSTMTGGDVTVHLNPYGDRIDLHAFVTGCPALRDPGYTHLTFLMLDMALGEYDVMTKVGDVLVYPPEVPEGIQPVAWADFRAAFDAMYASLDAAHD